MRVQLPDLEELFRKMWVEKAGESVPFVRASSSNLVVYTSHGSPQELSPMLQRLSVLRPCRALIICWEEREEVEAEPLLLCSLGEPLQVCFEQISFFSTWSSKDKLLSAISPFLIPDIPTYTWFRDIVPEPDLLEPFLSISDGVIFDSSPLLEVEGFLRILGTMDPRRTIDLNWVRTKIYRDLLLMAMSSKGKGDKAEGIAMRYGEPKDLFQAFFLLGWAGRRFDWDPERIIVELLASSSRGIEEVILFGDERRCLIGIRRTEKECAEVMEGEVVKVVCWEGMEDPELISEAIDEMGDPDYLEAVRFLTLIPQSKIASFLHPLSSQYH